MIGFDDFVLKAAARINRNHGAKKRRDAKRGRWWWRRRRREKKLIASSTEGVCDDGERQDEGQESSTKRTDTPLLPPPTMPTPKTETTSRRRKGISHFVAIRIEHLPLWNKIKNMQERIVKIFPSLQRASTAALALHVTLFPMLFLGTSEEIEKAKQLLLSLSEPDPLKLKIHGLNRFRSDVLFCDFDMETKDRLIFLTKRIGQVFFDNQLIDKSAVENMNPHATIMKMSKVRKKKRKIDSEVFACAKETEDEINVEYDAISIDLCSVNRRSGTYYPVVGRLMFRKSSSCSPRNGSASSEKEE
jgi:2'-5' RNA ligase